MASRSSMPFSFVIASHIDAASRIALGRNFNPVKAWKVISEGPPAARSRLVISLSCSMCGMCAIPARQITQSTHPSLSARSVSSPFNACFWPSVSFRAILDKSTAPEIDSGLIPSISLSCSSIALKSIEIPAAYFIISASKRGISQGTDANNRA